MYTVSLNFGEGSLCQGFEHISVQIGKVKQDNLVVISRWSAQLLAAPHLQELLVDWRSQYLVNYENLYSQSRLELCEDEQSAEGTQFSAQHFQHLSQDLLSQFNAWLDHITPALAEYLYICDISRNDFIQWIIETEDIELRQLPWWHWRICTKCAYSDVSLGLPTYQKQTTHSRSGPAKILVILGTAMTADGGEIDVVKDRTFIEQMSCLDAEILEEPKREEIFNKLWEKDWDILYFAGHSCTVQNYGSIRINAYDHLLIGELQAVLQRSVQQGLQLAIFNSCDGLGLASALEKLHLPQVIVMREPIPDQVAHSFLQYFLQSLAQSPQRPIYLAVKDAREKLSGLADTYPGAHWLPVLCQHPAMISPTWEELSAFSKPVSVNIRLSLFTIFVCSLLVTIGLTGLRSIGFLQPIELWAYDHLAKTQWPEEPDQRILVVTVDEVDRRWQDQQGMKRTDSLADEALEELWHKLKPHQPRLIASDIYHDFPFEPDLATRLRQDPTFIAACEIAQTLRKPDSIAAPPGLIKEQLGFTDWPRDIDGVVRRQFLGMTSTDECPTSLSFSLRVALRYLAQEDKGQFTRTRTGERLINGVRLPKLSVSAGGYQLSSEAVKGYQILVRYRSADLETISLKALLSERSDQQLARLVKQRIVLIGVGRTQQDLHLTPYMSRDWPEKASGVEIHGQMISQLLSAILDNRPLVSWWPDWVEGLWIAGWSLAGGLSARWFVRRLPMIMLGLCLCAYGMCWVSWTVGLWIPLIPVILGVVFTSTMVVVNRHRLLSSKKLNER